MKMLEVMTLSFIVKFPINMFLMAVCRQEPRYSFRRQGSVAVAIQQQRHVTTMDDRGTLREIDEEKIDA